MLWAWSAKKASLVCAKFDVKRLAATFTQPSCLLPQPSFMLASLAQPLARQTDPEIRRCIPLTAHTTLEIDRS